MPAGNNSFQFTLMCSIFRIRAGWIHCLSEKNPCIVFATSGFKEIRDQLKFK